MVPNTRDETAEGLIALPPEVRIALAYAPASASAAWRGLFQFDSQLARIALSPRDAMLTQLKLAWWRDACALRAQARQHPVLAALGESWRGAPAALVALVDAWEELAVADGEFAAAAQTVARQRAVVLARAAGAEPASAHDATLVWTLVALAAHAPGAEQAAAMRAQARRLPRRPMPRALRPLAVLDGLARRALAADRALLLGDRLSPLAAMRLGIFGR